jgi:hypothetical protein
MGKIGINWSLMANPYNWVVIFLMLAIPAILITVIHGNATVAGGGGN